MVDHLQRRQIYNDFSVRNLEVGTTQIFNTIVDKVQTCGLLGIAAIKAMNTAQMTENGVALGD